ncbi:MAG: hypothetical protein AAGF75_02740 [Cyanobacteria bacterium P01_H01_bin.130]
MTKLNAGCVDFMQCLGMGGIVGRSLGKMLKFNLLAKKGCGDR